MCIVRSGARHGFCKSIRQDKLPVAILAIKQRDMRPNTVGLLHEVLGSSRKGGYAMASKLGQ